MTLVLVPGLMIAVLASAAVTGAVRHFALRWGMLDVPGPRSSHTRPTPRGGGLGFVLVFYGAVISFFCIFPAERALWTALLGGLLVAGVGWWDDRRSLSSWLRLGLYCLAVLWAVLWLGGLPRLSVGFRTLPLGALGYVLSWSATLAFLNIYNFMDGIDGLAAGEGLTTCLAAGCLLALAADWPLAIACWVLAAGLTGFLPWNWHPARIFMGDVGSNFLGFTFCVLAIASENRGSLPALMWVILLGVFVVDGGATFLRRLLRREPLWVAHKTHAYQQAVQRGYNHAQVTGAVLLINAALGALAALAWLFPVALVPALLGSWAVLLVPFLHYAAGDSGKRYDG